MPAKRTSNPPASKPPAEKKVQIPPLDRATWALLEEALGERAELRPGKMFGCPGFFWGTKAVAVTFGDCVSITLPPERVAELVKEPGYAPFVAAGRPMSGWMLIDTERFAALGSDAPVFDEAIAYVKVKAAKAAKAKAAKAKTTKGTGSRANKA